MTVLRSYVSGAWTGPSDGGRPVLDAVTGEEVARVSSDGIDLGAALAYGAQHRRPGAARADLPPAGGAAQVARAAAARAPAGAVRPVGPRRRDPGRRQVRRRRRHRRAAQLRQPGPARAAERHDPARGLRRAARPRRYLRRPARPHPAARGRGADQRVQLPGLGPAGEVRPGVHRRRAQPGQAGHPDRLPDGPAGRADRGARGCCPRGRSSSSAGASAGCSSTSASRTWCPSPGRPPPPGSCAPTRPSSSGRSGSTPRRTR